MKNLLLLPIIGVFAACATTDPTIDVIIQKVEVPVYMPCQVEIPAIPEFNFDKLSIDENIFNKTKSMLADRKLHLAYEQELLVALQSCVK